MEEGKQLRERQLGMERRFLAKHVLGTMPVNYEKAHWPKQEYWGIKAENLSGYLPVVSSIILSNNPAVEYADFESELISGVKKLDELAKRTERRLKPISEFHSLSASTIVMFYFDTLSTIKMPFDEQVRSFNLHAKLMAKWLSQKDDLRGEIHTHYSSTVHVDAPLVLSLTDQFGHLIGTIGGLAYYAGGKPTIGITNIQGSTIAKKHELEKDARYEDRRRAQKDKYEKINNRLGENWRVFALRKALGHIGTGKFEIVGHPPKRQYYLGPTLTGSQYNRVKRQYDQTYRKTGFVPLSGGFWRYVGKQ
ncbi:MAG: hypothetical protein ABIG96_01020 [Candidatus Micrarchaeota archaeon]